MEILKVRGYQNQGARKRDVGTQACRRRGYAISFIRTFRRVHPNQGFCVRAPTVGSGLSPDLLTPTRARAVSGARGLL